MPYWAIRAIHSPATPLAESWLTIMMNAQIVAMTRLDSGPAAVTRIMLPRGLRMLRASTGTGLAHPNMKPLPDSSRIPGTRIVPIGSTCRTGLSVSRPSISAVLSPNCFATQPCATS